MDWIKENKWRLGLLAGLVGIAYLGTLDNAFVSDDIYGIVNNPEIVKFSWVVKDPMIVLNRLVYFIIANGFGIVPWPFRLVNIGVHLMTAIGVMVLIDKLINKTVATVAAVLVVVHPVMIESVTWISGGGYSWYTALLIWSLIFYIKAKDSWWQYFTSILLFLGALQYSEKAVILPGILLVYRLVIEKKRGKWLDLIPYIGLSGFWLATNLLKVGARLSYLEAEFTGGGGSKINPLIQIPVAIANYLSLIFWPDKLTLYHSELNITEKIFWLMAGITIIYFLVSALLLWLGFKGKAKFGIAGFFLVWLVIGLSPTLLPLGVAWIVAERYVYFGAIGVFVLIAWGLVSLAQKPKQAEAGWAVITLMVCLLIIRTLVRNSNWQNQDVLWLSAERTSPTSPQNHNNLGDLYGRRGDFKLAEWHFMQAISLNQNYADAMHNLANTYFQTGKLDGAIEWYTKALKFKPSLWQSHQQLGAIYYQKGDKQTALTEFKKALGIVPEDQKLIEAVKRVEKEL